MSWSGIQTFAELPLCLTAAADLRAGKVDVAIGGAPWEGTATGRAGTHLGPRAARPTHCRGASNRTWTSASTRSSTSLRIFGVCDHGDADVVIGSTDRTYASIRGFVAEILEGGAAPIILGGDHGITWPVADAHGRVGVVHFDAHADTVPDMRGLLAGHGTPMRRLIESGAV